MRKQNLLTKKEAIKMIGKEAVLELENIHVDYSNRLMNTGEIEFTCHHNLPEQKNGINGITAYYYQDEKVHDNLIEQEGELSDLDWSKCAGYELY